MGQFVDVDIGEAGVVEHFDGEFAAPDGAEALAALGEGDGHAVHGGDRVEERPEHVVHVVLEVAGSGNVLHEKDAAGFEGAIDIFEDDGGGFLIVNDIKREDEIEFAGLAEVGDVVDGEYSVGEALGLFGLLAGSDGVVAEVVGGEGGVGEQLGEAAGGATAAASDFQDVDAGVELVDEAGDKGEDVFAEGANDGHVAFGGHDFVEAIEMAVVDAAAVLEAVDDFVFDAVEDGEPLYGLGDVVAAGITGEAGGVFGGELVGAPVGVVIDDATGDHRAEPFADVALVEIGGVGEGIAGGPVESGEGIEEAGAMTNGCHEGERGLIDVVDHAIGEGFGAGVVEVGVGLGRDGHDAAPGHEVKCGFVCVHFIVTA